MQISLTPNTFVHSTHSWNLFHRIAYSYFNVSPPTLWNNFLICKCVYVEKCFEKKIATINSDMGINQFSYILIFHNV